MAKLCGTRVEGVERSYKGKIKNGRSGGGKIGTYFLKKKPL